MEANGAKIARSPIGKSAKHSSNVGEVGVFCAHLLAQKCETFVKFGSKATERFSDHLRAPSVECVTVAKIRPVASQSLGRTSTWGGQTIRNIHKMWPVALQKSTPRTQAPHGATDGVTKRSKNRRGGVGFCPPPCPPPPDPLPLAMSLSIHVHPRQCLHVHDY